jgi:hypothetical protein
MKKFLVFAAAFLAAGIVASAQYIPNTLSQYRAGLEDENGHVLTDQEVFQIDEDIYNETYTGACQQYKAGKILTIGGAVGAGLGLVATIGGAIAVTWGVQHNRIPVNENNVFDFQNSSPKGKLALLGYAGGIALLSAGDLCLSVGVPLLVIGKKRLEWVADDYNHYEAPAAVRFGVTENGAGLVMQF